jgi:Na+/glutamate symporter
MIVLGLLIRLKVPPVLIGGIGCLLVFGHNLLDYLQLPDKVIAGNLLTLLLIAVDGVLRVAVRSIRAKKASPEPSRQVN